MITSDPLYELSDFELCSLAGALKSGRLTSPFSGMSVSRWVGSHSAETIRERLIDLERQGMLADHIAILVEAVKGSRSTRRESVLAVQFVWTGPEVGVADSRDTAVVVRELFSQARETVMIVGFAVFQGRHVFRLLAEQMAIIPTLRVRLYLDVRRNFPDTASSEEVLSRFGRKFIEQDWPTGFPIPEIFYDPRSLDIDATKRSSLHAKCVVVDRRIALVTSANFTEAAQERNIEAGVLVESERFAGRLVDQFEGLVAQKHLLQLTLPRFKQS